MQATLFSPGDRGDSASSSALIKTVESNAYRRDAEYRRYRTLGRSRGEGDLADFMFAGPSDPHQPDDVFHKMHWGGQFVFVSHDAGDVKRVAAKYDDNRGFVIETPPTHTSRKLLGFLPLGRSAHYFAARKTQLIQPGEVSDRFTYQVQLVRQDDGSCVVEKRIPQYDNVMWRLRERFPDIEMDEIARRARKLVDHVFPVFLTREAAILNILQRDLPASHRGRVPQVLDRETDKRGFIRALRLNWLRLGGKPMSQLEFARQSADMLQALHDYGGVIHLDLRLDNIVITEAGVCFVDFGSAVRVGENLNESKMLTSLFDEMMRTSKIQQTMGKMMKVGKLTSPAITGAHHRVDKAVDFFYLALQFNKPHHNPDLRGLIEYDPDSKEAQAIHDLTSRILRPQDPDKPEFRSAADILCGIEAVARDLKG